MKRTYSFIHLMILVFFITILLFQDSSSEKYISFANFQKESAEINPQNHIKRHDVYNIIYADTVSVLKSFIILFQDTKDIRTIRTRLGINRIKVNKVDEKIAREITSMLYNKLRYMMGADRIVYREKDGISKSINRQLVGRVSKLGKDFLLSIKVVEVEKSKLLFSETVVIKKNDNLDNAIDQIVNKICNKESIW